MPNVANLTYHTLVDLTLDDTTYYLSDSWRPETYNSNQYMALGSMLSISPVTSQVSTSQTEMTISVSGISRDANYNQIAQTSPIRGGEVIVHRLVDDGPTSDASLAQQWIAFRGIINTFAIVEEYESLLGQTTLSLVMSAQSIQDFYYAQFRGEITNGADRRRYFSGDGAFDKVSSSFGGI